MSVAKNNCDDKQDNFNMFVKQESSNVAASFLNMLFSFLQRKTRSTNSDKTVVPGVMYFWFQTDKQKMFLLVLTLTSMNTLKPDKVLEYH